MIANKRIYINTGIAGIILLLIGFSAWAYAEDVNWQGPGETKIKEIRYFPKETVPKTSILTKAASTEAQTSTPIVSNVITPPVNGFVPWVAVSATNKKSTTEGDLVAAPESQLAGSYFPGRTDKWGIGIFDTGASAHVMGYEVSQSLGLTGNNLTDTTVEIFGATGSAEARVSMPIGVFICGLNNAVADGNLIDPEAMVGLSNVAIAVGQGGEPDLPTAIGSPLSVYYAAAMNNEHPISINYHGTNYTGPDITLYEIGDANIPSYPITLPLELKPFGSINVQYIFDYSQLLIDLFLDPFGAELNITPGTPSILTGLNPTQSTFYVHSVDLTEGAHQAQDRERFLFDTGAQVSVIGTRMAARLGINPDEKDFEVVIEGVNGVEITVPGFYIDSVTIPALGQWLEYEQVPMILLDIDSAAGGKLDGIIGMNLFTQYNLVFHGGGLFGVDEPKVQFQRISSIPADIAPEPRDGKVNLIDFSAMSAAWRTGNLIADIAPAGNPDGVVDLQDLLLMANEWLMDINP